MATSDSFAFCPSPRCCGRYQPTRRELLGSGAAAGGIALAGLSWPRLFAATADAPAAAPPRQPLAVKPILMYETPRRRNQTSWRSWGGIETQEQAAQEMGRIQGEMEKLKAAADFPLQPLPVSGVRGPNEVAGLADLAGADAVLIYAAGGDTRIFDAVLKAGKPVLIFLRHRSGPVSLWYEIISPRFLRQHGDQLAAKGVDNGDVVVDSLDELAWRLRALAGLKNTLGTKILAIGGPSGWGPGGRGAPEQAKAKFKFDIQTVAYPELKKLIVAAREDAAAVKLARDRAAAYLKDGDVKLETEKPFVENAFLLDQVFRGLMAQAGAKAITVNACMGTIMPIAETTACLTLSLLNDAGYLAFCESDFVVIPSGVLLSNITGRPNFLNDPTYPHAGVVTLAHCTGPRKMDGKSLEPARLVTHFESDYGAAPKVEMKKGTACTTVIPDFGFNRWVGFRGEIADAPFLPICRSQIDVAYKVPDEKIALNMPGFHWEFVYGDCMRELGYALKKIPIGWECLG
jgi:hypothetical protein